MKSYKIKKIFNLLLFVAIFFGFSYLIFKVIDFEYVLEKVGILKYILIPLISVFGSNTITASFLYPILFFLKNAGMNIFLLTFLAAIGGVTGDLIFLAFGKKLRKRKDIKRHRKIFEFFEKHRNSLSLQIFVFIYAVFCPAPNEIMTLALGYYKIPLRRILIPLILGNIFYYFLLIEIGGGIFSKIF